jgi:hypothetical protein
MVRQPVAIHSISIGVLPAEKAPEISQNAESDWCESRGILLGMSSLNDLAKFIV